MPRVIGIDLGTKSFDLCGLDNGNCFFEEVISRELVLENPEIVFEVLKPLKPLDLIVGPSGFGLPVTQLSKLRMGELFLAALVKPSDVSPYAQLGLRKLLKRLKDSDLNIYITPGVKHLPTVPTYRKVNKVDMGTADKVCVAALGIFDQAKRDSIEYEDTSFVLAELGYGYNAYLAIENGRVVDGIGGSLCNMGFLSRGYVDTELVYLLGDISKENVPKGGAAYVAGMREPSLEAFVERRHHSERYRMAWEILMESIEKDIAQILVSVKKPKEIILSGRIVHMPYILRELSERLSSYGKVRRLEGFAKKVKEASQGAALIADGLAGGEFQKLIDCIRLKSADGSVLDYIYLENITRERSEFNQLIYSNHLR